MSRRPRTVQEQRLARALRTMAPGGLIASESPVRRREGTLRPPRVGGGGTKPASRFAWLLPPMDPLLIPNPGSLGLSADLITYYGRWEPQTWKLDEADAYATNHFTFSPPAGSGLPQVTSTSLYPLRDYTTAASETPQLMAGTWNYSWYTSWDDGPQTPVQTGSFYWAPEVLGFTAASGYDPDDPPAGVREWVGGVFPDGHYEMTQPNINPYTPSDYVGQATGVDSSGFRYVGELSAEFAAHVDYLTAFHWTSPGVNTPWTAAGGLGDSAGAIPITGKWTANTYSGLLWTCQTLPAPCKPVAGWVQNKYVMSFLTGYIADLAYPTGSPLDFIGAESDYLTADEVYDYARYPSTRPDYPVYDPATPHPDAIPAA